MDAERDPAPPAPPWRWGERDPVDGAPLWRLVDFADALDARSRAAVEAALEASGLLDAWVRADGAVLDADGCDVVLPVGPPTPAGSRLDAVLRPDPPDGGPVDAAVIRSVLARVALAGHDEVGADEVGADIPAVVGTDGSWRLGPLTGRSTKPVAQYVGATARAAERARRLAELDARIDALAATRDAARDAETAAREARAAIEAWLTGVPSTSALLTAWTRLDERERVTAQADRRAAEAEEVAVQARVAEAGRRRDLAELAAAHDLPTDAVGLTARRERLRSLDDALSRHADAAAPLRAALLRWADDAERASAEADEAQEAAGTAIAAQERADTARAAADELEATVGASLREIQQRIAAAEQRAGGLERRERELTGRIGSLLTATGAAEEAARNAVLRLAEQEPALAAAVAALAAVDTVPGLLPSGLGEPSSGEPGSTTVDNAATFDLARGFSTGSPVPASVLALARSLAELAPPPRQGTEAALFAAWQDAVSGPAGDREPRVVELGGALAVVGRDDTGEHPIGTLATRLAAAVTRDAELLTERERRLFEEHVLGDLGESLRARRQEAEELVAEMNQLLRGVTTSQGIAVQLRWTLRDDVAADARRAVELLGQPSGALLPGERRELRDALHRLIEASRADAPEDSYSEHLARALDYRRWFAFRIRYTRPETPGTWHDLHRRSPLSQGEQKVVCYLPLFAAAAAHFGSLAGAAPHSPRFVLLDDAFPKIDVRTHPLLFGLLVELDLDFVITSERLWGDHATVPSLAIYEALRDPNERGIAQYRHTGTASGCRSSTGELRPTSWLADPALTRIWQVLRERLEGRGLRAEGRVVLSGLSREERHAVSALVGRPVTRATLVLSLADLDTTLAERSGIGGLQAVLELVTGHALVDRAARRAQRAAGREAPFTLARELVGDAPWGEAWLDGVRRSGVLARTADPAAAVRRAVETLARLPTSIARTELAVAVGGGAHALDDGSTVAALVLRALAARLGANPTGDDGRAPGPVGAVRGAGRPGVHDLPHPRPPRPGRLLGRGPDGARRGRGRPRAPHRLGSAAGRAAGAGRRAGVREPARAGGRGGTARRRRRCGVHERAAGAGRAGRPARPGRRAAALPRRLRLARHRDREPARRGGRGGSVADGGRPVPRRAARPASAPSRDADRARVGPRARRGDAPPRGGGARGGRAGRPAGRRHDGMIPGVSEEVRRPAGSGRGGPGSGPPGCGHWPGRRAPGRHP